MLARGLIHLSANRPNIIRLHQFRYGSFKKSIPYNRVPSGSRREPSTKQDSQDRSKPFESLEPKVIEPEKGAFGLIGEEISGMKLDKHGIITVLNDFYLNTSIKELAKTHHIEDKLFTKVFISFRRYCYKSASLPPELHIKFCDIVKGHGHVSDLYPFFLCHARQAFPHLECHEELRKISDLGLPHNWYPVARTKIRKVIFHAGPTNSGKTYHAMQRFLESKSGIYCGPLKLLASEIYQKTNDNGLPCDLVTGEEIKLSNPDQFTKSSHVSCTVEMAQLNEQVEVAIIDEIQMMRDSSRGWAWTRALLGIPAEEVHLCGEEAAIDVVRKILMPTGDIFEVKRYSRLTPLVVEDKALLDLKEVKKADCIVCFSKDDIFQVSMELEKQGHDVAVIYGTLPPGTKIAQCKKFNKLEDCQVMVATDAIGMGLNLSIGRVIFYSLTKVNVDERGNRFREFLSTSQCLQIAGRAGRFKTAQEIGYVTTFRTEDLRSLREIMSRGIEPIEKAGLHPTADQIEMFAFHLPHLSLCNLIDLFIDLCEYDASAFFMCDLETFKLLAAAIEHIKIPLRSKYIFCCAPVNTKYPFSITMFTKFVRQFSSGQPVTADWMKNTIGWPMTSPKNLDELSYLEAVFDAFELYLWLSYRFVDVFPEPNSIRDLQKELDGIIGGGVSNIVKLIKAPRNKQTVSN